MDSGKADIIAGIRELKAKAAEQLTGNEYYMIVQQLDSLATSIELSEEAARSVFNLISARLAGGAAPVRAGGPEVPVVPDTPAQPDPLSNPEIPPAPDSPAQPDVPPGPDVPSPVDFPAEPQTPQEASAEIASAEPVQIITPSANSFGMPQATVAVRHQEAAAPETAKPAGGLASAITEARRLVEERLSGNSYYAAANLLGQLQILPPPTEGGAETARPEGFEGALALLRREAAHLTGVAHDEAARVIAALESVVIPKPQPVAAEPAEAAAPQPMAQEPEAAAPASEPEPRTRFDDLADAAWERVRQVSAADARPVAALNGSTAPAPATQPEMVRPAPAAPEPEPVEMTAQDIGEAFNDGGSESRSSEPCYLHEFELAGAQRGAFEHQQPAGKAGADAASETERQAAPAAEAEVLTALAEAGSQGAGDIEAEDGFVAIVSSEAVTERQEALVLDEADVTAEPQAGTPDEAEVASAEPQASEPVTAVLLDEADVAAAQPQASDTVAAVSSHDADVAAAEPETAASEEPAPLEQTDMAAAESQAEALEEAVPLYEVEVAAAVPEASEEAVSRGEVEVTATDPQAAEPVAAASLGDQSVVASKQAIAEPAVVDAEPAAIHAEPVGSAEPAAVETPVVMVEPDAAEDEPAIAVTEAAIAEAEPATALAITEDEPTIAVTEAATAEAAPAAAPTTAEAKAATPAIAEAEPAVTLAPPSAVEPAAATAEHAVTDPAFAEVAAVAAEIAEGTELPCATASADAALSKTGSPEQMPPPKPAKRGFFGRLFGGSSAENRR